MSDCVKITYLSLGAANRALAAFEKMPLPASGKRPLSAYPCALCRGWHLTSRKASGNALKWQRTRRN